jgi:glycerol-3-phosphate acyltransferase PlsY
MGQQIIRPILGLLVSYLLGSIPTAYLFGKLTKGIDLRQHGSGNLGATNAFRVLGKTTGAIVLILDILKGTIAILLAKFVFYESGTSFSSNLYLCLASIAVVSGHNWTIFLGFKGGKGVATTLGALIVFSILIDRFVWVVISLAFLWIIIFLPTGLVSLASVISSISLPLVALFFHIPAEIAIFLAILGAFSVFRHKSNISRILQKKEARFNTQNLLKKLSKKTLSK